MTDTPMPRQRPYRLTLRARLNSKAWKWRTMLKRWRRALDYARDRLSADDAQSVFYDVQYAAGMYPLMILDAIYTHEETVDIMEEEGETPPPELYRLLNDACAAVANKWEDYSDAKFEAREWARRKAVEYAAQEGITIRGLWAAPDGD